MAEFENPFADPEAQNLFHVSSVIVKQLLIYMCLIVICTDSAAVTNQSFSSQQRCFSPHFSKHRKLAG